MLNLGPRTSARAHKKGERHNEETGHVHADADAADQAGSDEHGIVYRSCLKRRPDGEDDDGNHDGVLSGIHVGDPALVQGP